MEKINEELLTPLKYYYNHIKGEFQEDVVRMFDDLVKKSGIDIELNKKLSKEYEELSSKKDDENSNLSIFRFLGKTTFIIGFICAIIVLFYLYDIFFHLDTESIPGAVIYSAIAFLLFYLRFSYIENRINKFSSSVKEYEEKCAEKLDNCYESIELLNELMDSKHTLDLISRNIPFVKFDPYISKKRSKELFAEGKEDRDENENFSILEAVSGNILGNPFMLLKERMHEIVQHKYTGSITISWNETYVDYNGETKTRTRTQTLSASVVKPKPEYTDVVLLLYDNDFAKEVSFTREAGNVQKLSQSQIEKKVRKEAKKIKKMEEQSIKTGKSFVAMSNDKFEVLFNALDRDNETQFRNMFTPLAQQNIINLIENKEFGDRFHYRKYNDMSIIGTELTDNWDLDCDRIKFQNYSYEKCRDFFIKFNTEYFFNFMFLILPILSIPGFQQHKTAEYIYGDLGDSNYDSILTEIMANKLDPKKLVHPETKTSAIFKTKYKKSNGKSDLVGVKAYSYDIVERVDYISVGGGDGYSHSVPVHWNEYIALENESEIQVRELGIDDQQFDELNIFDENKDLIGEKGEYGYKNRIFAKIASEDLKKFENSFNKILKNI